MDDQANRQASKHCRVDNSSINTRSRSLHPRQSTSHACSRVQVYPSSYISLSLDINQYQPSTFIMSASPSRNARSRSPSGSGSGPVNKHILTPVERQRQQVRIMLRVAIQIRCCQYADVLFAPYSWINCSPTPTRRSLSREDQRKRHFDRRGRK